MMKALQRPGRRAAVVGAVVAVSAATLMGLTGIAAASTPGTCTENVNVRAEPSMSSRIVALCEAGTEVLTGGTRNGFVQITDLGGWASAEYVSVSDAPAATGSAPDTAESPSTGPSARPAPSDDDATSSSDDELRSSPRTTEQGTGGTAGDSSTGGTGDSSTGGTADDDSSTGSDARSDEDSGAGGSDLGGGLLG